MTALDIEVAGGRKRAKKGAEEMARFTALRSWWRRMTRWECPQCGAFVVMARVERHLAGHRKERG